MPALVPCPICGKPVAADDPNMPFCSDRCRTMDLANWATEKYSVPSTLASEFQDDEDEGDPGQGRAQ